MIIRLKFNCTGLKLVEKKQKLLEEGKSLDT